MAQLARAAEYTNCISAEGKGMNPIILPPAIGK